MWDEAWNRGKPNVPCARSVAWQQPQTRATASAWRHVISPLNAWTTYTAGLKCAPLTGPRGFISTASTATVANVFARRATAIVMRRELRGHDAASNHSCRQKQRADSFCGEPSQHVSCPL